MHPFNLINILGIDSERDWAVITGKSGGLVSSEPCRSGHLQLSLAHTIPNIAGKTTNKKQRKERSIEKSRDRSRSSFSGSSLRDRYAPVEEALNKLKYHVKEGNQ